MVSYFLCVDGIIMCTTDVCGLFIPLTINAQSMQSQLLHSPFSSSESDMSTIALATATSSVCEALKYFRYADDDQSPALSRAGRDPPMSRMSWAIPLRSERVP